MAKATWNGHLLAESDKTVVVEGNHYFPPDSINREFFEESSQTSICPWKGLAKYYDLKAEGQISKAAAWYYPTPKSAARNITNHVAFWKDVKVEA